MYFIFFFRNFYEGYVIWIESSGYLIFGNIGFDDYSIIEDIGDLNKNFYLIVIVDNEFYN